MSTAWSFKIHGPRGVLERAVDIPPAVRACGTPLPTIADSIPVTEIMSRYVVCASPDLEVDALVRLMVRDRLGCVPVVDERGHPQGMVTKLDIVEHLATPLDRPRPLVSDVMMPLAITLDEGATVAHAAALMATEDMHHVMIVSSQRLVGVVSTMDVTRWLAKNDGFPA